MSSSEKSSSSSHRVSSALTLTLSLPSRITEASGRRSDQRTVPAKGLRVSLLTLSRADFFRAKGSAFTLVFWLRIPSSWQEISTGAKKRFS